MVRQTPDCCRGFVVVVLVGIAGNLEQWLWMRQLNYAGIFWTLLSVQWAMFCSAFVVAFLYLWINLRQAAKNSAALRAGGPWSLDVLRQPFLSRTDAAAQTTIELPPQVFKGGHRPDSAGVALFFASGFYAEWDTYLRFRYGGSSEFQIRFLASMSGFMSSICPSMFCCKAVCRC